MAIEHARICGECERECPSWANRCPTCGSLSLVHRIVIAPPSMPVATIADVQQTRRRVRHSARRGREVLAG